MVVAQLPNISNKFFNFTKKNNMAKMISEYGGKEKYTSKKQMAKHEKAEGKKVEKKGMFPKMKKK
jgi:hypothetical protein